MVDKGTSDNVVSIRPSRPSSSGQDFSPRPPLPPAVRRRRRLWLLIMVAFFLWSGMEMLEQAARIQSQQAALEEKRAVVASLKDRQKNLKEEIRRLKDEEYMAELARKMGYGKQGEEIYETTPDGE